MKTFYSGEFWIQVLIQLADNDYVVIDSFLPEELLNNLERKFILNENKQLFEPAKIGSAEVEKRITEIRSDYTYWLDRERDSDITPFFELVDELIRNCAEVLYLSLQGFEFHFARYPKGGFYKAHLDQFDSRSNRMLSMVIYLNHDWAIGDGGELRLLEPCVKTIEPLYNRAVIFRSDIVLHEVLQSNKLRRSITGWILKRPSGVGLLGL